MKNLRVEKCLSLGLVILGTAIPSTLIIGCVKGKTNLNRSTAAEIKTETAAQVTSIQLVNNTLTLSGTGLDTVTSIGIENASGSQTSLSISSASSTSLVAAANSSIGLILGHAYNLVVTNAAASTTVPFTYDLTGLTTLSVNGVIHSTSGGMRFPDGTTQTTASVGGGSSHVVKANGVTLGNLVSIVPVTVGGRLIPHYAMISSQGYQLWISTTGASSNDTGKVYTPSNTFFFSSANCVGLPAAITAGESSVPGMVLNDINGNGLIYIAKDAVITPFVYASWRAGAGSCSNTNGTNIQSILLNPNDPQVTGWPSTVNFAVPITLQ